jgi:methylaspartate mutase epsilon subunit
MFLKAEQGVLLTEPGKTSRLNGFPVPIHGVKGIEKIMENIDTPFQIRAGSPDHRLAYEIGLAGGASSVEGGFLCYLYPYDKETSPSQSLVYWKYIDKLAERYQKKYQVIINREFFGPLTCTLIEPSIAIVINAIQAILSAKAGVRCISVGLAEQGNRAQDIAAMNVLKSVTRAHLNRYGYHDVTLTSVFHQYMSAFPTSETKASNLIINSSMTAALAGADRIMTKTPVESSHIPTKEDNAEGLRLTKTGINKASDENVDWKQVQTEAKIIESEVQSIMTQIIRLGCGSLAKGAMLAFENGILDIPFSPNIYNRGKLLTARDRNGAIRYVNPEILPLEAEVVDFHKQKIYERMLGEGCYKISEVLEQDLTRIWKNDFARWPLDDHYLR